MKNVKVVGNRHKFVQWQEVPQGMAEFFKWLHSHEGNTSIHPILLASEAHYQLVNIHPFSDENGRCSRLLMNLVLLCYNYPLVSVVSGIEKIYFAAEQIVDSTNNFDLIHHIMAEACYCSLDIAGYYLQKH